MILVTRLDRQTMFLNPDHIVSVEETPDTVITLYNGHHILVKERCQVILNRVIAFKTTVLRRSGSVPAGHAYLRRLRLARYHRPDSDSWRTDSDGTPMLQPLHRQDT